MIRNGELYMRVIKKRAFCIKSETALKFSIRILITQYQLIRPVYNMFRFGWFWLDFETFVVFLLSCVVGCAELSVIYLM